MNNDGAININDSALIGLAYRLVNSPNNNEDLNGDNDINILDVIHVGRNYDLQGMQPCVTP